MKKNKRFLSWYMCIGIFILMLWLVNFPSLGDCDCTLKLEVRALSYTGKYTIVGDYDLNPAGCCGASVANKKVTIDVVWEDASGNRGVKIYETKTDKDGKFEQDVTRWAQTYWVRIYNIRPCDGKERSYESGPCKTYQEHYDWDFCLHYTAEQAKAAPALTSWGSITLSILLAGSLAWMIRRKMIARRSRA